MIELKPNQVGNLVSETHRECTNCGIVYVKTSKTVTTCPKCNCERVKNRDLTSKILNRSQQRARKRNLEFNIDKDDIDIPEHCPILGIPLIEGKGKAGGKKNSPSIDRIDPTKGYIKGNVRIISHLANAMKSFANEDELVKFANWIIQQNYNNSLSEINDLA